jgi:MFS family permease
MSGVYMLPSIIAQLFSAVLAGKLVGKVGRYLPFALASAALMSIGYGLCSTFSPGTTTGEWIGYQILFGVGRGMGFQMPIVAVQNTLPPAQAPLAISLLMFTGMMFGALFLSFSTTIFTQSLRQLIPQQDPGADAAAIIEAGATGFRKILDPSEIGGILVAYSKSFDRVFYMVAALAAVSFFFAFGLGWKDIREKKAPEAAEEKAMSDA